MTPQYWTGLAIALLIPVGAIAANLYNGWAARRQAHQIALHKDDPTVPLKPPPTRFTKFIIWPSDRRLPR